MPNDYYSGLTANSFFPLRAQNIYNPQNFGADLPQYDPVARMNELYQPQDAITQLYMQQLKNMPQREPPGKLRTIAAILAGLGANVGPQHYVGGSAVGFKGDPKAALETTDLIQNKPYYEKLQDWQTREKALGGGAELEARENTNKRILANETVGRELQEKGQSNLLRHQLETESLAKQKSDQQYQVAIDRLEQKAKDEEANRDVALQKLQADIDSKNRIADAREAELRALNARHTLALAQRDRVVEEQKNLHENLKKKWEAEDVDRNTRLKDYEEYLKQRGLKGPNSNKTTTVVTEDKKGNITGKRTTTTTGGSGQQPNDAIRARAIDILKNQNKPQTENNIKFVMDKLGKQ